MHGIHVKLYKNPSVCSNLSVGRHQYCHLTSATFAYFTIIWQISKHIPAESHSLFHVRQKYFGSLCFRRRRGTPKQGNVRRNECSWITYSIRYTSQTQKSYYGVQGQVNDNMFRPFYSSTAIIRSSKVILRGVYKVIECLLLYCYTVL